MATTLLWPLADRPRLVAGVTGPLNGKAELTDDELAASLGKGGRLDQLLGALESVLGTNPASRDRTLNSAVCIAIDPDLLITAQVMTKGYRVLASPSDPDGATRAGTGADQAQTWLDRLRAVAASTSVSALLRTSARRRAREVNSPLLTAASTALTVPSAPTGSGSGTGGKRLGAIERSTDSW